MTATTIVVIVDVALAALLFLGVLAWVSRTKRNDHRHAEAEAETIRGQAREENRHVAQREARAEETAAKARAAQAEADIKTAQAKGLQQQAAGHRSEAVTSRHDLDELQPAAGSR